MAYRSAPEPSEPRQAVNKAHQPDWPVIGRIFRGLGLILGGKATAGVLSLGYMVIAARALGPSDYGVLVLMHAYVTTVCGLLEFPVSQAVVRYGAQAIDEGVMARLARLLRFTALVEGVGGGVAILAIALLAPVVGPKLGWSETAQNFAVFYSFAALGSLRSAPAGYLQLMRRFDLLGIHNAVAPAARLIGAGIVALGGYGLKGFLIAWLIAAIAEWAVLWLMGIVLARRQLGPGFHWGEVAGVNAENPKIWSFMIASNADTTFGGLAGRLTPLIVGWLLGPAAAGLYAVGQRATVIVSQPAQILGASTYAEFARLVAAGAPGVTIRHTLARVIGIAVLAAVPVMLLIIVFAEPLIRVLAGPEFLAARDVMIWLVAARVIFLIAPPVSAALLSMGLPGRSVIANLSSSLGLLPLLPLLMHSFGVAGAGMQSVIQACVGGAMLVFFVWRASLREAT